MKKVFYILLFALLILFSSCGIIGVESNTSTNDKLMVSILDVGQGDAILIRTKENKFILIDSGSNSVKEILMNKLNENGVKDIDVLIATHPHEDHIGNMDDVIKNFNIKEIYMPKVTTNTKTFINMMNEIKNKNLKIKTAKSGIKFNVGDVEVEFLAPNSSYYEDLNDYSAVVKLKYGNNTFLFMGDAEKFSESEILKRGFDVKADVIKLGHHGSSSSSSEEFIRTVDPKFAVISVGKDNSYGHPHKETMLLMKKYGIKVLRTDEAGDVVFLSDGLNLEIKK
ncbi:ComEC/Rec2 family competence protein [Thermobrachium celere]|uniref:ComEC/Rec2 family competence protein n=1 Tax=Thermobrachium celere TaxID=53422 RepID=UPI00194384E8|nr:ComEC/Rec2 family competence protein [Thermobrachium celere]GFR36480.1 metallo beta-lactamase superfamily lipoprotein [Thermobrachium celere]